ncbi:hypothetical protein [Roseomonas acroporae]|nr:hypothetical protein [Roseomonas acroporae]
MLVTFHLGTLALLLAVNALARRTERGGDVLRDMQEGPLTV